MKRAEPLSDLPNPASVRDLTVNDLECIGRYRSLTIRHDSLVDSVEDFLKNRQAKQGSK